MKMKIFEPNFLNAEEINTLKAISKKSYKIKQNPNNIVDKIINRLQYDLDFVIKNESYWRIEHHPIGHIWHQDTGDKDQMTWCQIGVSILLTDSFTGGETFYAEDAGITNIVKQERSIGDLCAHTSNEWHMVTPHKGNRIVFLMFI